MFGISKPKSTPLVVSQEKFDTLIGRQTEIHGRLRVSDSIRIDGRVVGNVESTAERPVTVVVSVHGQVQGDIVAHRVVVAGPVSGHIQALERVELHKGSLVQGDIRYGSLAVEHGARILGSLFQLETLEATPAEPQEVLRLQQNTPTT